MTLPVVYVYRFAGPLKGRRCRIVRLADFARDRYGTPVINTGEQLVAVEFEDGARDAVQRQALVPVDSKLGRQCLRAVAYGATSTDRWRRWRDLKAARLARAVAP